MAEDPVDVLIIGAGASGAAFAWSLAETRMNILCLEQGDWMNPAEYPTRADWELRGLGDFALSPNTRRRPRGLSGQRRGIADRGLDVQRRRRQHDPLRRPLSALPPVGLPRAHARRRRRRLADRLRAARAVLRRERSHDGRGGPRRRPRLPAQAAAAAAGAARQARRDARARLQRLGWHWWPSDSAIATREYEGRAPCINVGTCLTGCAQGAKASTDVTYWPAAVRRGVRLATRCRVREITLARTAWPTASSTTTRDGVEHRQKAEVVVLACNGIGTPRLLLNSRSKQFPDGLANRSGLVGKNLMFHPYAMVTGVFDEPLEGYKGPTGCCLMSQEFYETDRSRGFVRGYSFEVLRGFGPVRRRSGVCRPASCRGALSTTRRTPTSSIAPRACSRSARIYRNRTTA